MRRPRRVIASAPPGSCGALAALVLVGALSLSGCTSTAANPPTSPTGSTGVTGAPTPPVSGSSAAPTTAPSVVPVTVDGMLTGPGVDDASISFGLLVDPASDRGFTAGVKLWRDTVNGTGGICDRTIQLTVPNSSAAPDLDSAYQTLGRDTLGLITLEPGATGLSLASRISADGIQAFTPEGMSAQLRGASPIVLGATDDILAINAAAYLASAKVLAAGSTLGVLIDDSARASDALAGLTWWARTNNVTLRVLQAGEPVPHDIPAIFAATSPSQVSALLAATAPSATTPTGGGTPSAGSTDTGSSSAQVPATTGSDLQSSTAPGPSGETSDAAPGSPTGPVVVTTLDGYLATGLPAGQENRLLVATVTPASGADHPGVLAVDTAFADAGGTDPGPRMLEGYATGEAWARLLQPMCAAKKLTRASAAELLKTLAPASPDSLFGPTNPAAQAGSGQAASRVSAISQADPSLPGGLKPVTLLESAPGIADYRPS